MAILGWLLLGIGNFLILRATTVESLRIGLIFSLVGIMFLL
jgi:hypothetical protein